MKKIISLALVLAVCFSLCACGSVSKDEAEVKSETEGTKQPLFKDPKQEAFEISKEAYENLVYANEIIHKYVMDIYEAWRVGAHDVPELIEGGCAYLADELDYLTEEDVRNGIAYLALTDLEQMEWEDISEEKKAEFREKEADNYFYYNQEQMFSFCYYTVKACYRLNGKADIAQEYIDTAKTLLKQMSAEYSDYEYYPQLKEYYTTVSSYFELCNETGGYSFEQFGTTTNEYNNKIRDYQNDLGFIFDD